MRYLSAIIAFTLLHCKTNRERTDPPPNQPAADTVRVISPPQDISYENLYGLYLHESNGPGFHSTIEIKPMGNDLHFILTVQQPGCEWELQGTMAMMYNQENEYAGFYDSETCRLVFTFFLKTSQLRVETAGLCVALPGRCSVGGVYRLAGTNP
ncbi:MAG: hypothetical protein KatS3mg032_2296 [Cyclobacteriaceae bacterium]|nr:MAG: hypothetical protein KatS3mg032_2296 [Cyclobacteriaceae bacterium]